MRTLLITITAAMALAGCGDSPTSNDIASQTVENAADHSGNAAAYQTKIADVDFLNLSSTIELAKSLSPSDRYAFSLYVIAWKAAKVSGDETEIRDASGNLPVTVKDAVAIQQALLEKNRR
ncbi:MAG TPA: hypothetical protein VFG34_01290 [Sphingopyxis sp.]|nr:hypothetical protein [Sphingopyxis sp.]